MEKILLDEKYEQLLFQIPLLRDLPHNIKQSLLEKLEYSVYSIDKKDIVARQGTPCKKLYILLEGKLRVDIIDGLGNKVMVEYIVAPRAFATPHLFGSNTTLPARLYPIHCHQRIHLQAYQPGSQSAAQLPLHNGKLQCLHGFAIKNPFPQNSPRKVCRLSV